MKQYLVSESDIIGTYPARIKELARKYIEAKSMSASGKSISDISEMLDENFELVRGWINTGRKPTPIKAVEWLIKQRLLPLKKISPKNKKHQLLVKLHAFVYGDGSLYECQIELAGQEEDIIDLRKDLHYAFPDVKTKLYKKPNKCNLHNCALAVNCAYLARLLATLGAPIGDKTNQPTYVPEWVLSGHKDIVKLWLEVFMGNEGSAPSSYDRKKDGAVSICLTKQIALEKNMRDFLEQVRHMFLKFGIQTSESRPCSFTIRNYDGIAVGRYYFKISGEVMNLLNFYQNFKFRYAKKKQLRIEKNLVKTKKRRQEYAGRIRAYRIAKELRKMGLRYKKLKEFYRKNREVNACIAWNTFYNYSKNSGRPPRYVHREAEICGKSARFGYTTPT